MLIICFIFYRATQNVSNVVEYNTFIAEYPPTITSFVLYSVHIDMPKAMGTAWGSCEVLSCE